MQAVITKEMPGQKLPPHPGTSGRGQVLTQHTTTIPSTKFSQAKIKSHGHMAPSFRRKNKNLVCFYCNKKSGTQYDGLITEWNCAQCESTNFLDENGEITDPPVATESAAPGLLRYTNAPPQSQLSDDGGQLFCTICVKNQHLYTASLAQYHVETDPSHPRYKEIEREYFTYRKSLERLYPQVCEDCEPKVLARLRDAGRTAKADHLRRAMDKSRARRYNSDTKLSFAGFVDITGKCLWYTGLVGQLSGSVLTLPLPGIDLNKSLSMLHLLPVEHPDTFHSAHYLTWVGLVCSVISIWWNPMFKQMNKGYISHISGFGDWYKLQFLSVLVRLMVYNTIGSGVFADSSSAACIGANSFIVVFISMLALMSYRSLKVDLAPLWAATPEKLSYVGPKSTNSPQGVESMADILEQIGTTPSRSSRRPTSSNPLAISSSNLQIAKSMQQNDMFSSLSLTPRRNDLRVGNGHLPLDLSLDSSARRLADSPLQLQQRQQDFYDGVEEMEWTPTESQSQHRAFNSPQSSQRKSESFGHAPMVEQPSPFWYKVPAAPITPAQKIRNPPNQPALRVASQEVKENFFGRVTHRHPASDLRHAIEAKKESGHSEIAFAQQKFFAPSLPNEAGNTLADLLTGFSLGSSEQEVPVQQAEHRPRKRYLVQSVVLFLGLLSWSHAVYHPSEQSQNLMLVIMLACLALGMQNLLDGSMLALANPSSLSRNFGILIRGFECALALYVGIEVFAGRGHVDTCTALGALLDGEMLVHNLWLAARGG